LYYEKDYIDFIDEPGTYTVRSGDSVRRTSQLDTSMHILNLIDLIEDEYSAFKEAGINKLKDDFDSIEKGINRIRKQLPEIYRTGKNKVQFYALANFRDGANYIYYNYWETQGDLVNNAKLQTHLEITSDSFQLEDSYTVIPIQKGRTMLNKNNFHSSLKKLILSRNVLVTMADIENYCLTNYEEIIQSLEIKKGIVRLNQVDRKIDKVVQVIIKLKRSKEAEYDKEFLSTQIENELQEKSSFFTPIKVEIEN